MIRPTAETPIVIDRAKIELITGSPQTRWCMLTLVAADGTIGVGEATLAPHENEVLKKARTVLAGMRGTSVTARGIASQSAGDLVHAAVLSALSQAVWDLTARAHEQSVAEAMAAIERKWIPVYANINRRTRDRTPAGFARSAIAAMNAGFSAFKIAPFDEVDVTGQSTTEFKRALQSGLNRIEAVHNAIGPNRSLMVDCHWRFTPGTAATALEAVTPYTLGWFECPIAESHDAIPEIVRLRSQANRAGTRLAGCERETGIKGFEPYVVAGAYDVVMPDIKYIGSMDEMLALAHRLEKADTVFSPHNPSGPVSHAASLHLCAIAPGMESLEMQFDESPVFRSVLAKPIAEPSAGLAQVPDGPGLGISVNPETMDRNLFSRIEIGP